MRVVQIPVDVAFVDPLTEEVLQRSVFAKFNQVVEVVNAGHLGRIADKLKGNSSVCLVSIHGHAQAVFIDEDVLEVLELFFRFNVKLFRQNFINLIFVLTVPKGVSMDLMNIQRLAFLSTEALEVKIVGVEFAHSTVLKVRVFHNLYEEVTIGSKEPSCLEVSGRQGFSIHKISIYVLL